jgi:hypothetical protein
MSAPLVLHAPISSLLLLLLCSISRDPLVSSYFHSHFFVFFLLLECIAVVKRLMDESFTLARRLGYREAHISLLSDNRRMWCLGCFVSNQRLSRIHPHLLNGCHTFIHTVSNGCHSFRHSILCNLRCVPVLPCFRLLSLLLFVSSTLLFYRLAQATALAPLVQPLADRSML